MTYVLDCNVSWGFGEVKDEGGLGWDRWTMKEVKHLDWSQKKYMNQGTDVKVKLVRKWQ